MNSLERVRQTSADGTRKMGSCKMNAFVPRTIFYTLICSLIIGGNRFLFWWINYKNQERKRFVITIIWFLNFFSHIIIFIFFPKVCMNKICRWQERTRTKIPIEKQIFFNRNHKNNIAMGERNSSSNFKNKQKMVNEVLDLFYRRIY